MLLSLTRGVNAGMYVRYIHLSDRYSRVACVVISISVCVSTHSRGSAMVTIIVMTAVFLSPLEMERGQENCFCPPRSLLHSSGAAFVFGYVRMQLRNAVLRQLEWQEAKGRTITTVSW